MKLLTFKGLGIKEVLSDIMKIHIPKKQESKASATIMGYINYKIDIPISEIIQWDESRIKSFFKGLSLIVIAKENPTGQSTGECSD